MKEGNQNWTQQTYTKESPFQNNEDKAHPVSVNATFTSEIKHSPATQNLG